MAEATFGSALGSGLGSILSFGINTLASRGNMDYQYELNQRAWRTSLQEGPALQMEGYRKAGINPLLALGHSADSMAPVGSQQAPSMDLSSAVSAALQAKDLEIKDKLADAQADNLNAETGLKETQQQYQQMLNKVFPQRSEKELQKMSAEIAHLKQQSESLHLDNNLKRELAQGNDKLRNMLGNGKVADAMYMLGNGNIAQGVKIAMAGVGKTFKGLFSFASTLKGFGSVEKIVEKVVQDSKGDVLTRTLTHTMK